MTEVQNHGFVFENWVKAILGVKELAYNYTQKWDIQGETPISVKCMGITNALEFGSTVRIWEINKTFTLVVGRWEQVGFKKIIRSIDEIDITPDYNNYVKLFGVPPMKAEFRGHEFIQEIDHGPRVFNEK